MLCASFFPLQSVPQHFFFLLSRASGHDELGLEVRLDVGLPHRVVEVQVQGALAGHAAVAVGAAGLAVGHPVVGGPLVPPGLPAQPLLLHQQLQALHLAAGRAVLRLTKWVTRGLAHADLTLALHQRVEGRRWAASAAGGHGGSFGREDRHGGHRRGGRGRRGRGGGRPALGLVAELGEGGRHALVVARGAQEVVEDLQDGADVSPRAPVAVLAVWVQSA